MSTVYTRHIYTTLQGSIHSSEKERNKGKESMGKKLCLLSLDEDIVMALLVLAVVVAALVAGSQPRRRAYAVVYP